MKKAIIYGTSFIGREIYHDLLHSQEYKVIAFCDFFPENQGTQLLGLNVLSPMELQSMDFDVIIPASVVHYTLIRDELISICSVDASKIDISFSINMETYFWKARETFLRQHAKLMYAKGISGSVAEGGVHKGDFAVKINRCFPDRKLYLFDTFEGYDARDTKEEIAMGGIARDAGRYNDTSPEMVMSRMHYKENVIIKKGYFPDTALDIDDNFVFVSLDFNMYSPTVAGLEFFYQRLNKGGVILIDDYFAESFAGIPKAVDEFCIKQGISVVPVSDFSGCAIIK